MVRERTRGLPADAEPVKPLRTLKTLFDLQMTRRMGRCNVRRWTAALLPLVEDAADPLGTEDLVTHRPSLSEAAAHDELFPKKEDGCITVVLRP